MRMGMFIFAGGLILGFIFFRLAQVVGSTAWLYPILAIAVVTAVASFYYQRRHSR